MSNLRRRTHISATLDGESVENILAATVSLTLEPSGMHMGALVLPEEPPATAYNDEVKIYLGAGGDDGANNRLRFTGLLKQYANNIYPREVSLPFHDHLSRLDEYRPSEEDGEIGRELAGQAGIVLDDLIGIGGTFTDENVVLAALQRTPFLVVDHTLITGTGTDLGDLPADATVWNVRKSARNFVRYVDTASFYQTFTDVHGNVHRAEVTTWPADEAIYTFTEGTDIFEFKGLRTSLQLRNGSRVDGYNFGAGSEQITFTEHSTNPVQGDSSDNPQIVSMSTPLAGRILSTDSGAGFACQDLAVRLLATWIAPMTRAVFMTPRDDMIGPGITILVTTPSGLPDRAGIAEFLWVQKVDITVSQDGVFSQQLTCIGGGTGDGNPSPIDWTV